MNYNERYLSQQDIKLFQEGDHFQSYRFLGSRLGIKEGIEGAYFSVWAPNAKEISVVGDFNDWQGEDHVMKIDEHSGIWSLFIPEIKEGNTYKYEITTMNGTTLMKSDPYALFSELRPCTASKVVSLDGYSWSDQEWIEQRRSKKIYDKPVNIYEVHFGSWRRKEEDRFNTYTEIADELIDYICEMGYTHIEILPLAEHPLDGSWGYQTTGYYSVTSRFGYPNDFMNFVDRCHQKGIGVIMDWVPGHFCKDAHGLYRFDGTALFEHADPQRGENYDWGTANFDFGKPEVQSFLISNAIFWFELYHIDGMRVDAVANMLYLTYGKKEGSQIRNKYGGNENLEAVDFIKKLNKAVFEIVPGPLMIAEESTAWPMTTAPTYIGGLGFNYKWNMGWMNDMLKYMEMDPIHRKWYHNMITFTLMYAFSENFVLPLSHDEVVHGKKSLLNKMPGDYWKKFAGLRLFYGYMMSHPGKKLLFMGGEFGQFIEWKYDSQLDWHLLDYPMHYNLLGYVKALNHIYLEEKALWELDHGYEGFTWIDHQNVDQSIISFIRRAKDREDFVITVCNFTPMVHQEYKVGVPKFVHYKEIFNSDHEKFGGSNQLNEGLIAPIMEKWNSQPYCIYIKIPPLAVVYIKAEMDRENVRMIIEESEQNGKERNDRNDTGWGAGN